MVIQPRCRSHAVQRSEALCGPLPSPIVATLRVQLGHGVGISTRKPTMLLGSAGGSKPNRSPKAIAPVGRFRDYIPTLPLFCSVTAGTVPSIFLPGSSYCFAIRLV